MSNHYQQLLRDYMLDTGINQEELAERFGVSSPTLSNWLSGKHGITAKNRAKIEKVCSKILDEHAVAYRTLEDTVILAFLSHPENLRTRAKLLLAASKAEDKAKQ